MIDEAAEIANILDLLRPGPPDTFQRRLRSAEQLMFADRSDDSSFLRKLLSVVIESDEQFPNADTLLEQAVCSLAESDLREFAARVSVSGKPVHELTSLIACQVPDAFPIETLRQLTDYRWWFESPNPLANQIAWHFAFEEPPPASKVSPRRRLHPTWSLPAKGETVVVGGKSAVRCLACGHPRVHLVTLNTVPEGLGVSLDRLTLETCANCPGPAFFSHDQDGKPRQISPLPEPCFDFDEVYPMPKGARLAPTPQRWTRQIWGVGGQNLFRVGGLPSWIHYPEIPAMPGSERPMSFLAQFDSFLDAGNGDVFLWGSGGLLYVFWDDETRTSCTFAQWT
nr:hypothetical protein [Mesorhizobium sp.]